MSDRIFRFGLVAGPSGAARDWTTLAKRAENLGFSTLLAPDGSGISSSFSYLAAAAATTEKLRLGNFVLASPLLTAGRIAWDAASLDQLSQGRFELGLGAGRPDAHIDARLFGASWDKPGERVRRTGEILTEVRRIFEDALAGKDELNAFKPVQRPAPPVMIAGRGDRLLTIAAQRADIVAIAGATEADLAERHRLVRASAGDRFDDLELSYNIWVIGDSPVPPWLARFGVDPATAKDNEVISVLNGDQATAIDVLKRRRDTYGTSYLTINSIALEAAAPIVEALAGH